jgi:hypothetical protein
MDAILFLYMLLDNNDQLMMILYLKNMLAACFIGTIILSSITTGFCVFLGALLLLILSYRFFLHREGLIYLWALCLPIHLAMRFVAPVLYDEISVVHFSLYVCSAAIFGAIFYCRDRYIMAFFRNRHSQVSCSDPYVQGIHYGFTWRSFLFLREKSHYAIASIGQNLVFIALALCVAALFLYNYPKFLYGMEADIDPSIKEIWLYRVAEMKSPFEHNHYLFFTSHVIILAIAILSKILDLVGDKSIMKLLKFSVDAPLAAKAEKNVDTYDMTRKNTNFVTWIILITVTICYTLFAGFAYRMLPYSFMFGSILVVEFCMSSRWTKKFNRMLRIILTFFMTTLFVFLTAWLRDDDENNNSVTAYSQRELFQEVDRLSDAPVVIMAHSNDGAPLLYYTKHSVVGAPYHRQVEGIINSFKVMEDKFCESEV